MPHITSLSPAAEVAGVAGFTLRVNGTDMTSGAIVEWNGSPRPTTFVSAVLVEADVSAAEVALAGTAAVRVANPAPGGGRSDQFLFLIRNPSPFVTGLEPDTVVVGGAGFTLTVAGLRFAPGAQVRWGGATRPTTVVSPLQLTAEIPASDIAVLGAVEVSVSNPAPGGGVSPTRSVLVGNPLPVIADVTPDSVALGADGLTLTVTGSNFVAGSDIEWDGSFLATAAPAAGQLTAALPVTTAAGGYGVRVRNPGPGGGMSDVVAVLALNPAPTLTSLAPDTLVLGSDTAFTITGTGFIDGTTLVYVGTQVVTRVVASSATINASIAGAGLAAGTYTVTLVNGEPGGGTSGGLPLVLIDP